MNEPLIVHTAVGLPLGESALPSAESPASTGATPLLVAAARGGDEAAFGQLYALYGRMVHGILLARVAAQDVDDLVQDVFVAAWQRLSSLRDDRAFGGWLASIARNRATDHHRVAVDTVTLDESMGARGMSGPDVSLEAARALIAIRTLPQAYRETLVMRLVEGMTGPEIAERTGLTPASVRVNLHRGLRLLREKLGT